jgi:DNA-binding PadR family transcriptional regulator
LSSDELSPFSLVVLAMVGEDGAGPHDLEAMLGRSPLYWSAARSQWYSEPKRLTRLGYLAAERRPGKTTPRTHYTLTDAGRRALRSRLAEPARFTRMQNEAALRLLAGDLLDDQTILSSLRPLRAEIERLDAELTDSEHHAREIPQRTRHLLLSHRLARKLLVAHREWLDELEAELADPPRT